MTGRERFQGILRGWREGRVAQMLTEGSAAGEYRPSDLCFTVIESGKLSSGEQVQLALAMAVLGYEGPARELKLADILRLDNANLAAVAEVFADMAGRSAGQASDRTPPWMQAPDGGRCEPGR